MLTGQEVGLRAVEEDDLEPLRNWRNRPQFRRYFREYRELNKAQQKMWFDEKVNSDISTRMFSIVDIENHRLLGACGLCYIDWINRTADFSIYLGADDLYIDERFAPDAARLLIAYAYDELALHRLWAEIYAFDTAKQRFFETLGFKLDGRHRGTHWADGQWHDSLYYGLLNSDVRPLQTS